MTLGMIHPSTGDLAPGMAAAVAGKALVVVIL
jgi:hypothetical protein